MKCRDCRYWLPEDQYIDNYPAPPRKWGKCQRAASESGEMRDANTLAFAADYEGYAAELITSPDFGCVQFAAKRFRV